MPSPTVVASMISAALASRGIMTTGNIFYVDSGAAGAADNAKSGRSPTSPFATLSYAFSSDTPTANNGDIIVVMPGHAETISAAGGITQDIAGVKVICLGEGEARPTFTMSAVASTYLMSAANSYLENALFKVTDDATVVLDMDATDCWAHNCEFRSKTAATAKEWVTAIDINGGAANACDRCKVTECVFYSPTAGATQAIELGEVADAVTISGCTVYGDFGNACIHNPTGKVLTRLVIKDCILENTQTGDHSIELVSACTGVLARNIYKNDMTQATGVDPGSCNSFECYHCDTVDVSGILCPAAT